MSDKGAVADSLKEYPASGGTVSVVDSTAVRSGDLALTHSHWRPDIPGGEAIEGITAEIVRQSDGTWKYVIDNPWGGAVLEGGG